MQATQSNNASDFFESDSTGPRDLRTSHGRIHDLPSSFNSPIQAARRYLERQRDTSSQADGRAASVARAAERHPVQEQVAQLEITREQDRRLERSLYEGHSIEAALSFEEPHGFAESGRAYLADSDGSEPLFPYAAAAPASRQIFDPDPDTVRGAIFRLAHEAGAIESRTILDPPKATPASSQVEGPVQIPSSHPSAFADVARRVWAETHNGQEVSASATVSARSMSERAAEFRETSAGEVDPQVAPAPRDAIGEQILQARALVVETQAVEVGRGSAFEDAALAHDACNLLSAVGLYSDLLNFPGVLAEQHRHYAEELKLIAGRSQALIDRMLNSGGAVMAGTAPRLEPKQGSKLSGQRSAEALATDRSSDPTGSSLSPIAGTVAIDREISSAQRKGIHAGIHVTPRPVAMPGAEPAVSRGSLHAETSLIGGAYNVSDAAKTVITTAAAETVPATSLVDLLMRWGSLLSTLAHGTLDVSFGPLAGTPVPLEAEPLERILVNLVRNARAATIAGGAIRIGVGVSERRRTEAGSGRAIVLTVDDSGCGMTEAQIGRILGVAISKGAEPDAAARQATWQATGQAIGPQPDFVQSAPHAGYAKGQGLGLQVVRDLVGASGGRLAIESCPGRGTRVEICWPVAAASACAGEPVPVTLRDVATKTIPAVATFASPIAWQPALKPSSPIAIGPDGFSEAELRAMMLRLHRQGSPLARFEASRSEASRSEGSGSEASRSESNTYPAVKGAIAC